MGRKVIALLLSLVILFGMIVIVDVTVDFSLNVGGTIHYVNKTGSGGAFMSIQAAIDAADHGDTVFVFNGTYTENLVVNKRINLTGMNRDNTTIDGGGDFNVVVIEVGWVNITGFTITNSGDMDFSGTFAGLRILSSDNTVYNNNISSNNGIGINIIFSDRNNISNNTVYSNGFSGLSLWDSQLNNITHNDVSFNSGDEAIVLRSSSNNNTIINNTANNNGYGISLSDSNDNTIAENKLSFNTLFGIWLGNSDYNLLENNTAASSPSGDGLYLKSSENNTLANNSIINNGDDGIVIFELSNYNSILNNTVTLNGNAGLYFDGPSALSGSKNNYISNNTFTRNTCGIWFGETCNYNTITNNNISSNNDIGIYLIISSWNNITNNNVSSNINEGIYLNSGSNRNIIYNNTVILNERGIAIESCSFINIENNSLYLNSRDGIHLRNSGDNFISNNTATYCGNGIYLRRYSKGNEVINNNITLNDRGIYLTEYSDNNNISHNNVTHNYCGIELGTHCNYITFIENTISFSDEYGILLASSEGDTLINNTMIENGIMILGSSLYAWTTHDIGISNTVNEKPVYYWKNQTEGIVPEGAGEVILANCTNITIKSQEVLNGTVGIELGFCSNITITKNNASNNFCGFYSHKSNNSEVVKNIFMNNGYGIILASSSSANNVNLNTVSSNTLYGIYTTYNTVNNTIHHNNIINNTVQAQDATTNQNQWDYGYPSGGNYWSDFDEPAEGAHDDFYGIYQNVTGSDGIVDNGTAAGGGRNPYVIDSNSQDNYPVIEPIYDYMILRQGWNLISIPLIQEELNLTRILGSIKGLYDAVQWYNITGTGDFWKHLKIGKSYGNDLFKITEKMGFWIHIIQAGKTIFRYDGIQSTSNQTIQLHPGWNMVGYPSRTNHNRNAGLNNLTFDKEVDSIWTFNATTQKWKELTETDYFEIGKGYYIHAIEECAWVVPL